MSNETGQRWAICRLQKKAQELGCAPKKADFDEATRARIKAYLGPWPRALEAAGLKKPKETRSRARSESRTPKTQDNSTGPDTSAFQSHTQ